MPRVSVAIFLSPEELAMLDEYRDQLHLSRGQAVVRLLEANLEKKENPAPERSVSLEDY